VGVRLLAEIGETVLGDRTLGVTVEDFCRLVFEFSLLTAVALCICTVLCCLFVCDSIVVKSPTLKLKLFDVAMVSCRVKTAGDGDFLRS